MPFKSKEQKGYLLAHPEITDQKGRPVGKKWAKKYGGEVAKGKGLAASLGVAATGTAVLAARKKKEEEEKKGRVKKMQAPVSDDPFFNQEAAQKAFNLVMKMDHDTAEMFTYIVASDLFETEVENNLDTIQKALNRVFAERTERVKKALVQAALNAPADQIEEYKQVYEQVEEITKAAHTPQFYGYNWQESDFRRDPGTGRFMVKVHHTMTKPLKEKAAKQVIGSYGPSSGLSTAQRARFQDEYRQVSAFLSAVQEGGLGTGNSDVIYHLKDSAGNTFAASNNSGTVPEDILANPDTELLAMEAKPTTLSVGGAAYGLSEAMGRGPLSGDQIRRANLAATDLQGATTSWAAAGDPNVQSARMFTRLQTSGKYVNAVAPPGSTAQMAGKFAEIVGQYGPEAERVLGPAARKTAYRYRGTEKTPDEDLVRLYGQQIQQAKRHGVIEEDERQLGFGTRRGAKRGDFIASDVRRPSGARERRPEIVTPSVTQMGRAREGEAQMMVREPTWAEQGQGTAAVAEFLRQEALPDKHLYRLHVAAGNTPPSEGILINAKGQITSQAVGYGDDHYVPFNLKNLKDLKGGEYIRTRSVGGPTSEDIYTGLMSGARRLTVVSRSGTFTVEFDPKLRGGRRHNDKARRMTSRYEQILDAVQSGTVDRQNIPKRWRDQIRREVEEEFPPGTDKATIRDEVKAKITEFKENPEIEGRDAERAEEMIMNEEMRASRGEISEKDVGDFRRQIYNELFNMKEVRFRLNGVGYEAGLKTLQEQFPYYIKVSSKPTRDEELLEFELDEGYVEPGRGRPTKVNAGYFGTKINPEEQTGFISGSRVNYQRGKTGGGVSAAAAATTTTTPTAPGGTLRPAPAGSDAARRQEQQVRDVFSQAGAQRTAKHAKWELLEAAKLGQPSFAPHSPPEFWNKQDEAEFQAWLDEDPENEKNFERFFQANAGTWKAEGQEGSLPGFASAWSKYSRDTGMAKQVPFAKEKAGFLPPYPYSFSHLSEDAYHAGARLTTINIEMNKLDKEPMLTTRKELSSMSDKEMSDEIERTKLLATHTLGKSPAEVDVVLAEHKRTTPETHPTTRLKSVLVSQDTVDKHLETIHRQRYLKEMKKVAKNPPPEGGNGGGAAPGPTGGLPTPPPRSGPGPIQTPRGQLKATAIDIKARDDWKAATAGAEAVLTAKMQDRSIPQPQRNQAVHDHKHVKAFFKWLSARPELTANEIDAQLRTIPPNAMQYIAQNMPKPEEPGEKAPDFVPSDWQ